MTGTIFTDVSIFDGTGRALCSGQVLVRGNTIEAVAEGDERLDRSSVAVVAGEGRTLMPGVVEAHAHLTWPRSKGLSTQ
jgi:imidazolonepropionase-like amidohydrolase